MRLRALIEFAPGKTGLSPRRVFACVHLHAFHGRKVNHHAAVTGAESGDVMAAAAHRDEQIVIAREIDRMDHIGLIGALHNRCRALVYQTIPYPSSLIIAFIIIENKATMQIPAECIKDGFS